MDAYSSAQARLHKAAPEMLAVLHEIESFLDDRADVIDGDYGQPKPNREMTLLVEVRRAIAKAER